MPETTQKKTAKGRSRGKASTQPKPPAKPRATRRSKAAPEQAAPEEVAAEEVAAEASARLVFRVDRAEFAEAVAWVARCLPARPSVPVLAGIVVDVGGGTMRLSSFDYEVAANAAVPVDGDQAVRVLLPGKVLADVVGSLPDETVELAVDGVKVVVACGDARFTLTTMPVEDYPELPKPPPLVGRFDGAELASAVAQVAVAVGTDDTLPLLTGIRVEFDGDTVTMAATDRYRLAVRQARWQPGEATPPAQVMVPGRVLSAAAKTFAGGEVEVSLSDSENDARLGLSGSGASGVTRSCTVRLLDPQFINFRELMPDEFAAHADLDVAPFVAMVKRVTLVAGRETPVRLTFAAGEVRAEAGDGEHQGVERMPVEWTGEKTTIAFGHRYLLDAVGAAGTPKVRLHVVTPIKPAVVTGVGADAAPAPGYKHLVMPVRVSN
jgi:DNA polymerase-3 subunit beta